MPGTGGEEDRNWGGRRQMRGGLRERGEKRDRN